MSDWIRIPRATAEKWLYAPRRHVVQSELAGAIYSALKRHAELLEEVKLWNRAAKVYEEKRETT